MPAAAHAVAAHQDEAGRLAALRRYHLLDTGPEAEFDEITRLASAIFDLPVAAVSLMDADRLWFKAVTGFAEREVPRSTAVCHHTIQGDEPLAVEDLSRDARFADYATVRPANGLRAYLGVPLATPDGHNLGTLCVAGPTPRRFSQSDADVLQRLARLAVAQMELRMLARRDALTGALCHRAFGEMVDEAAQAARSQGEASTLLLLDIDHFKSINDRFGHPAGDRVIQSVAIELARHLGGTDRVGRLGGDEFGVLFRQVCPDAAMGLAQRIRDGIAAIRLPELAGAALSISGGLAPWRVDFTDPSLWNAAADSALYAAKKAGRDRILRAA